MSDAKHYDIKYQDASLTGYPWEDMAEWRRMSPGPYDSATCARELKRLRYTYDSFVFVRVPIGYDPPHRNDKHARMAYPQ